MSDTIPEPAEPDTSTAAVEPTENDPAPEPVSVDPSEAAEPQPEPSGTASTPEVDPAFAGPEATPPEPEPVLTIDQRMDRVEAAVTKSLNLRLDEFDGQEIKTARANRLAAAAEKAAEMVKDAFEESEMTLEQRLDRMEKALRTGGQLA